MNQSIHRSLLLIFVWCAGLFLASSSLARDNTTNWMADYVRLRVLEKNLQVPLSAEDRTAVDLRSLSRPRIVGGTDAGPGDNPFQVALLMKSQADNARAQFCGGTLVSQELVVTAAHCSDFVSAGQVQVLTGARKLDGSGTRRNVVEISLHPNWNSRTFDNDVAVWKMDSRASGIPLATLATEDGPVGGDLLATGWGRLSEGGSSPIDLQRVEVPLVSRTNCNDSNSYNGDITGNMICAGFDSGGRDACQGDSGGPLTRGSDASILTGITSWGFGCARPNLYGVYTRVSAPGVRSFLEKATRDRRPRWHVSYGGKSRWQDLAVSKVSVNHLKLGDFNGDGKADVFASWDGKWHVSYGGTSSWQNLATSKVTVNHLKLGDFNGDGKTDVFASW